MSNLFNPDNKFFVFMTRVADLIIVNLLFAICSLPIITIGPSMTALYYVTLKMVKNEETYPSRNFFHSFRQNFKQGVIINLIMLVALVLLSFDLYYVYQMLTAGGGTFYKVLGIILLVITLIYAMVVAYVYPILARFYNSTKNTLRNALLMSIRHLPYTVIILVLAIGPVVIMLFSSAKVMSFMLLFYMLIGFSVVAYVQSILFVKIFANYMPKEEEDPENDDPEHKEIDTSVFTNLQPVNDVEEENKNEIDTAEGAITEKTAD